MKPELRNPRIWSAVAVGVFLTLGGWAYSARQVSPDPVFGFAGPVMGTRYSVKGVDPQNQELDALQNAIRSELERIDALMSTYRPDSELSLFNDSVSTEWFPVSADTVKVVDEALHVAGLTGGALDVTVGPLVDLWGFGAMGHEPPAIPQTEDIDAALNHVGYQHLQSRQQPPAIRKSLPQLRVDLSAVAKGYAVDRMAEILSGKGIDNYLVEIGGELRGSGSKPGNLPWRVAVEKPDSAGRAVQQIYDLVNQSVATSGDYRNFFENAGTRYSHLIDPRIGRPVPRTLASVSVFASTTMRADALATAMLVMGSEKALSFANAHKLPALLVYRDGDRILQQASDAMGRLGGNAETGSGITRLEESG